MKPEIKAELLKGKDSGASFFNKYVITDFFEVDENNENALYLIVSTGQERNLKYLIEKCKFADRTSIPLKSTNNIPDQSVSWALRVALSRVSGQTGRNILQAAALVPNNPCLPGILDLFAEEKARKEFVNQTNGQGNTALYYASSILDLANIKTLRKYGATYDLNLNLGEIPKVAPMKPWEVVMKTLTVAPPSSPADKSSPAGESSSPTYQMKGIYSKSHDKSAEAEANEYTQHIACVEEYRQWLYNDHQKEPLREMKKIASENLAAAKKASLDTQLGVQSTKHADYLLLYAKYQPLIETNVDHRWAYLNRAAGMVGGKIDHSPDSKGKEETLHKEYMEEIRKVGQKSATAVTNSN